MYLMCLLIDFAAQMHRIYITYSNKLTLLYRHYHNRLNSSPTGNSYKNHSSILFSNFSKSTIEDCLQPSDLNKRWLLLLVTEQSNSIELCIMRFIEIRLHNGAICC